MKSIKEKAKAYDEAIKRAQAKMEEAKVFDYDDEQTAHTIRLTTTDIFPELAESEDERIRKEMIEILKKEAHDFPSSVIAEKSNSWIAYLEKQKGTKREIEGNSLCNSEQKPDNTSHLLSWSKEEEKKLQCLEGIVKSYWTKAEQENNELKIKEASEVSFFLKTIQKSPLCWIKCVDALPNKDGIYLVVTDGLHNDVYDMARYDSIEGWHKASEIIYWMPIPQLNDKSIIEQKPAWSEEDEAIYYGVIETEQYMLDVVNGIKKFDVGNDAIRKACTEELNWLKSLKDRCLPQPKQEWSEEDKEFLGLTLSNLAELKDRYGEGYGKVGKCIDWLKSLQPQPINVEAAIAYQDGYQKALVEFSKKHQEWTEDDIEMIDRLIRHCEKEHEELCNDRYGHQEIVSDLKMSCRERLDWLESLRNKVVPQNTWKPSDEQIKGIECAIKTLQHQLNIGDKRLNSLYDDLKKLREE